jgi:hypothetical protein
MFTVFSDACFHSLPHVWCNPVKSFCSDSPILKCRAQYFYSILVMCASCFVHVLLQKAPKTEIQWWQIWGSRGPQVLRNNATTKELTQHLHCRICCVCHSPILLKPAILLNNFQKGNEKKSKAVPLHALEAPGGGGGRAPTHTLTRH